MELMLFNKDRTPSGYFKESIDIEIGDSTASNDFETPADMDMGMYIAHIGGEFGGIVEKLVEDTSAMWYGRTWRKVLEQHIIEPPQGSDHLIVSGDLHDVIRAVTADIAGGFFDVAEGLCGVYVERYKFARYCTGLNGLMDLCSCFGRKLILRNLIVDNRLVVQLSAEKPTVYDRESANITTTVTIDKTGINHLICAASGELEDRIIVHLYLWPDGTIRQTKYYTGFDEHTALYDYSSQQDLAQLIKDGEDKLKSLASYTKIEIQSVTADEEMDIGDIVRVQDPERNILVEQPIIQKVLDYDGENAVIDYKVKGAE